MQEYKRYVNSKQPGQLSFVTTSCLDSAHLFMRPEMRTRMVLSIVRDCVKERAKLYAYVVMSNHIHLVVRPHELMTIAILMQRVKVNSVTRLRKYILPSEQEQLGMQEGLNRHQYWQNSFRGNSLLTTEVIQQKVRYTHLNPIRAGLVDVPEKYLWSSFHVKEKGLVKDDDSLDLAAIRDYYQSLLSSEA